MEPGQTARIREIPYNYTSFSDREIVIRLLGESMWEVINELRSSRRTGHSARMLFEILGDIWVVLRNPFIQDDLLVNRKRLQSLIGALRHRLNQVIQRAEGNELALQLIHATEAAIANFEAWFPRQRTLRQQLLKNLSTVTRKENIEFDGLARVSHVTDASDWRVEYPLAVIKPESEQEIAGIVLECLQLNLSILARGGGTGYTGGAVPLTDDCVVINTEKLDRLQGVFWQEIDGRTQPVPVVHAEAGVVTRRVSELADAHELVFAVDPTSQDACTIGGNIAMNAGGKKAALWGTTIDNLLSWKMVSADGTWLEVRRLKHNMGKIHEQAFVAFSVTRFEADGHTAIGSPELLKFFGKNLRKQGLGKDVTDKYLGGLPGMQKEGCDGIITSAEFVLHRMPNFTRTVCLEFFGNNVAKAVSAIVDIKEYLDGNANVMLSGLEHLDDRYLRAVNYSTKSARYELPKMLLLVDVSGDNEKLVAEAASKVVQRVNMYEAEGFIAVSPEARRRFWQDRSRTAAIAAHTNAFKINEDVVIPLPRLAEYTTGIERINIEQSVTNKLKMIHAVLDYLNNGIPEIHSLSEYEQSSEGDSILESKLAAAKAHLHAVANRWQDMLNALDQPAQGQQVLLDEHALQSMQPSDNIIDLMLRRDLRISYRIEIERPLKEIFSGGQLEAVRNRLDAIHAHVRASRLFAALHMHAGDGNVHTNIPVNSNDYAMLQEAEKMVDRIMALAVSLGGVISGEHGIGLTKYQYLDQETRDAFAEYKEKVDPQGYFNRGKLLSGSGLTNAYTPSLRLLQQEALILEESELGLLNDDIRNCLRCGKCKPECNTHIPRANLYYSPRDKILATGLIIEAFLYEEQTRRGVSIRHFDEMNDVADHCTVCHKCKTPCPVDIDFGDVSIRMRNILRERGRKRSKLTTRLAMGFLNTTDPTAIKVTRKLMIEWGYKSQRILFSALKLAGVVSKKSRPPKSAGAGMRGQQLVQFVRTPMPAAIPKQTARKLLGIEDSKFVPIIRDPANVNEHSDAVFYFPGCGSERLFSQISLATLAMLYQQGTQTVLPPGYLCCGYPQSASGDNDKGSKITTENRVLFHRVANTLNYLDIKTVIVSCGTCMDQLLKYEFEKIFPGCKLLDIHEYLMEKGVSLTSSTGTQYMYHDPCHSPMKSYHPITVASKLMGQPVENSSRCCGEAGTLAVSRPDIAAQVRFKKGEVLQEGVMKLTGSEMAKDGNVKLLTSCPACQQGLSKYSDMTGLETDYIVVEMAKQILGDQWQDRFLQKVASGGVERVLL